MPDTPVAACPTTRGDEDPFDTEALFHKTAEGILNAGLILCKGVAHPASGEQFDRDVVAFLEEVVADDM